MSEIHKDMDSIEGFITDGIKPKPVTQLFNMVKEDTINKCVDRAAWFNMADLSAVYTDLFAHMKQGSMHSAELPLGSDAEIKMRNLFKRIMTLDLGREPTDFTQVKFAQVGTRISLNDAVVDNDKEKTLRIVMDMPRECDLIYNTDQRMIHCQPFTHYPPALSKLGTIVPKDAAVQFRINNKFMP